MILCGNKLLDDTAKTDYDTCLECVSKVVVGATDTLCGNLQSDVCDAINECDVCQAVTACGDLMKGLQKCEVDAAAGCSADLESSAGASFTGNSKVFVLLALAAAWFAF